MVIQVSFLLSQAGPIDRPDIDDNIQVYSNYLNKITIFIEQCFI